VDRLAHAILGLRGPLAYVLIFGVPALEASAFAGFLFPGELAVLLGGVLAFQGRVSLAGAVGAAVAGAVIGDSVGYAVGARYGERLLATSLGRRLVKPSHRERAEELIRRKGASAVFVGRFTAVLRVLIPGLAGMSEMAYGRFLAFNLLGGVLWASGFVLLGYAAGNAWRTVAHEAARASAVLAALLVLIGAGVLVARWVVRHEERIRAAWRRLLEQPRVVAFRRRYHRQIAFVLERLDPRGAFGLYLTVGLAATVAFGWGLGAAVQDLFAHEELVGIDRPIGQFLAAHRSGAMSQGMRGVTTLGSPPVVVGLMVVAGMFAVARQRSARPAVYLVVAVAGGYAVERALKLVVHRAGPLHAIVAAAGSSFPSGHTVAAVTLYGGVAFTISRLSRSWRAAVWAWLAAAVVVLLVGTSRVYLGLHHASDVVAAAALGAMWLALCSTTWLTWDRLGATPTFRQARNRAAWKGLK
jgi:membrane protein DedA with SNARE-associated domain/membrane-associated phospholipid phosphatase